MRSPSKFLGSLSLILGGLFLISTIISPHAYADKKKILYIVTTTPQIADMVSIIAGNTAIVESIIPTGVDPHGYSASKADIQKMVGADIVFYNGLQLEKQMDDTLKDMAGHKTVLPITRGIRQNHYLDDPDKKLPADPHVWMDISNWIDATNYVAQSLSKFKRSRQSLYERNAHAYEKELKKLDEYVKKTIKTIPEDSRILVTPHNGLSYFAKAYGLETIGIQGLTTEKETPPDRLDERLDQILEKKITVIFNESTNSGNALDELVAKAEEKEHPLSIGGILYVDTPGGDDLYEGSYIGMIDYDTDLIVRKLGGVPKDKGFKGKLAAPEAAQ